MPVSWMEVIAIVQSATGQVQNRTPGRNLLTPRSHAATLKALVAEKELELARLEAEAAAARAYIDSLRAASDLSGHAEDPGVQDDPVIQIRRLMVAAGEPLYIDDVLHGLGMPLNRDTRTGIRQLLLPWVRRGEIFTRPRPSTFGLVEWCHESLSLEAVPESDER